MDSRYVRRSRLHVSGLFILAASCPFTLAVPQNPSLSFFTPTPSLMSTPANPSETFTPAIFIFEPVSNMTVCGSSSFSWLYSGPQSYDLGFGITNDNVGENGTIAVPLTQMDGDSMGGLPSQGSFAWSPVVVPAGRYTLIAAISDTSQVFFSQIFSVLPSDDTSCLVNSSSYSGTGTTTSSSLLTTTMNTNPPAVGAVSGSSSKMNGGKVAGIVIAALVAAGLLIAALLLYRTCRRRRGGRFGSHQRKPSRLFEKKGWQQSGVNGTFGNTSTGSFGLAKSPIRGDTTVDSKVGPFDAGAGLRLDDSTYGQGLGLTDYPHRLSYAKQARNNADIIGASSSEEDVSDVPHSATFPPSSGRVVTVPLAIHPSPRGHTRRESGVESVLSDSTAVGSPQSAKFNTAAFNFSRPRPAPRHSAQSGVSRVTDNSDGIISEDPFASPPPSPSPPPRTDIDNEYVDRQAVHAHDLSATVSGTDGTQLPLSLFHPSSQYIASPRSTFPQSVSASDLSVAPSTSSDFDAPSSGRPSRELSTGWSGFAVQSPGTRRTLSARKPVPYTSNEALELTPRSSPTSVREDGYGVKVDTGSMFTKSGSGVHDWSSAAAHSHSAASVTGRSSTSSRSSGSETQLASPNSPYVPTTSTTTATGMGTSPHYGNHLDPFAGVKGFPQLNHKSSFGDKPMHYLIPDPPAPEMQ